MPLRLPDLSDTSLRLLTACGELQIEDRVLLKWLAAQKPLEARFRVSGKTGFILVFFEKPEMRQHLHIDVAPREFFGRKVPKAANNLSQVKGVIQKLSGQAIKLDARGLYAVPRDDLPEFIRRSLAVETEAGDVSLRTTGGQMALRGTPVYQLRWWLGEDDGLAWIELKSRLKKEINDSYLVDICQVLDSAFSALALRKSR